MEDINRNTRTLIISFSLALMVMIPLRFVEVGQLLGNSGPSQVLGESVEFSQPQLEAPYNELESSNDCLTDEYVDRAISFLDAKKNVVDIDNFESRRCR